MNHIVHFFDPRPLRGALLPDIGCLPTSDDPNAHWLELREVDLDPSGDFVLSLQQHTGDTIEWRGSTEIRSNAAGDDGLVLTGLGYLVFSPEDWPRVTDLFMKLANRIY